MNASSSGALPAKSAPLFHPGKAVPDSSLKAYRVGLEDQGATKRGIQDKERKNMENNVQVRACFTGCNIKSGKTVMQFELDPEYKGALPPATDYDYEGDENEAA